MFFGEDLVKRGFLNGNLRVFKEIILHRRHDQAVFITKLNFIKFLFYDFPY